MNIFIRFLSLQPSLRILVLKSLGYGYLIRVLAWLLPFRWVLRFARHQRKNKQSQIRLETILGIVNTTSNYVPRATCLTRALTGQILLQQYGYNSKLCIGVLKQEGFEAHAWLEKDGQIIFQESEKDYIHLVDLE